MKQTNPENQQTTSSPESAKEYGVGGETEPENDRCGGKEGERPLGQEEGKWCLNGGDDYITFHWSISGINIQ